MTRTIALFIALLTVACATPSGPATDSQATVADTTDTASDTASLPVPGLQAVTREGACTQNDEVSLDLGTDRPMALQVEIIYADGKAVVLGHDGLLWMISNELREYESPMYREGSTLVFPCGYKWEVGGPYFYGELSGPAVSYRASWLVLN